MRGYLAAEYYAVEGVCYCYGCGVGCDRPAGMASTDLSVESSSYLYVCVIGVVVEGCCFIVPYSDEADVGDGGDEAVWWYAYAAAVVEAVWTAACYGIVEGGSGGRDWGEVFSSD